MSILPNNFLKHPTKLSILSSILLKYQFFLIFVNCPSLSHTTTVILSLISPWEMQIKNKKIKCTIKARVYLHNDYENAFYTVDEGTDVSNF